MNPAREEVMKLLADLSEQRSIADFLIDRGITGTPGTTRSCPIARYLQQATGRPVQVMGYHTVVTDAAGNNCAVPNPLGVVNFIDHFDCGRLSTKLNDPDFNRRIA